MLRYALIRILQAIPMVIAVIVLVFVMLQFTPGDPVQAIVGQYPVPPDFRAAIVRLYHLNDPLPVRLLALFRQSGCMAIWAIPSSNRIR